MGRAYSIIEAIKEDHFPPAPQWSVERIPDLSQKVIIVTGGSAGIGKQMCRFLFGKGATIYMASRDAAKAQKTIDQIRSSLPRSKGALRFLKLDLSSLSSVKSAAEEFERYETRLDVLFNNSAIWAPPRGAKSKDGYDLSFATNCLGHFAFSYYLLPILRSTALLSTTIKGSVRIIHVASGFAEGDLPGGIDFTDPTMCRHNRAHGDLYNQSKLGNILVANELARRYTEEGILSFSCHPGISYTDIGDQLPSIAQKLYKLVAHSPEKGALTPLWLGVAGSDKEGGGDGVTMERSGGYGIPWCRFGMPRHEHGRDPDMAETLWDWCERELKKYSEVSSGGEQIGKG